MSTSDQLEEAVLRGIIQPDQAKALRELAEQKPAARNSKAALDAEDDEGFRFISGFNDIFLAFGVVMLLYGLSLSQLGTGITGHALAVVVLWVLAEIFAGRLKRTLPSMIVAAAFTWHILAIASLYMFNQELYDLEAVVDWSDRSAVLPLMIIGIGAVLLFYARFKLPFSLFPIGLQVIAIVVLEVTLLLGQETINLAIPMLLATGLILFAIAMWFDTSDRMRLNRLSDNAFWLHLLASPLTVHSIMWQSAIWTVGRERANSLNALREIAPMLAATVLGIFLVVMVVALIIDRRAMLVSSLIYVSVAITWIISQQGSIFSAASFTPILIGTAVIALGVGWRRLRRLIFAILPIAALEPYLPPVKV